MSHQTSVSLQEKFCLCFCFQDVSVANGTTALLHTEHIWYPRIREVNDEHCLLRLLCVSSHLQCWSCPVYWSCLHWALFFSSYWYVHLCCEIQFRWHRYKIKLVEVLCATRQYCFLPSFLSFFLFLLSCAAQTCLLTPSSITSRGTWLPLEGATELIGCKTIYSCLSVCLCWLKELKPFVCFGALG